jgi:hypothetical protein
VDRYYAPKPHNIEKRGETDEDSLATSDKLEAEKAYSRPNQAITARTMPYRPETAEEKSQAI